MWCTLHCLVVCTPLTNVFLGVYFHFVPFHIYLFDRPFHSHGCNCLGSTVRSVSLNDCHLLLLLLYDNMFVRAFRLQSPLFNLLFLYAQNKTKLLSFIYGWGREVDCHYAVNNDFIIPSTDFHVKILNGDNDK